VEDAVQVMRSLGIDPAVLVNGNQSILAYAAQEEVRAKYLRLILTRVRQLVSRTSRWFKNSNLAAIRQVIDQELAAEEDRITFVSSRARVTVTDESGTRTY
ncbi:MAG: hypothetical protein NUV78_00740, partial [Candidatus Zambryskibacteria bacterium]|nr:hypothetical protein [Candidatus Zambryskibacteria bacterium]